MGYRYNAITGDLDVVDTGSIPPGVPTSFTTDSGIATPALNIINLFGTSLQGISSAGAGNTITLTIDDATTSQKGVVELATDAESIAGSVTDYHVINPSSLKAKLGTQTGDGVAYGTGDTTALGWTNALINGQIAIGSTAGTPQAANLTSSGATIAITNGPNTINLELGTSVATSYVTDSGTAVPAANIINIIGTEFVDTTGAGSTVTVDLTTNAEATAVHGWNGAIIETAAVTVTSDGVTITCSVQKSGGGNLTVVTSLGYVTWVTAPDTVSLTAGSDTSPQINYVYWLESTATLTAATGGWPAAEHAPIATVLCQSAASLQTKKAYKVHAWTDHVTAPDDQGHLSDINLWIRNQNATWKSGVNQTYTITPNGGAADNVTIETVSGIVLQLHMHAFPAFSNPIDYYVVNDFTTPYNIVTDLNALLTDSQNVSMSGKYFSLVLWGVVSEDTGDCKMFINLPSGSYNNATSLTADPDRFTDFNIPSEFKGTGFLISQWNLRHQVAASGTWTSVQEIDLRGLIPPTVAGGGGAQGDQFPDNTFRIFDDGDNTKLIAFEASSITTATTRTLTVQDANGTIALSGVANFGTGAQTFTDHGFLLGSGTSPITATAAPTNGQLAIGNTGNDPSLAVLASADASVTITNGAGTIDLSVASTGLSWSVETGDRSFVVNEGVVANKAGLLTMTLPATAAIGNRIRITGINTALGWKIAQNANQQIHTGTSSTTVGGGGSLASSQIRDSLEMVCVVAGASTEYNVLDDKGNITVV